jgi:hypothetical protein
MARRTKAFRAARALIAEHMNERRLRDFVLGIPSEWSDVEQYVIRTAKQLRRDIQGASDTEPDTITDYYRIPSKAITREGAWREIGEFKEWVSALDLDGWDSDCSD